MIRVGIGGNEDLHKNCSSFSVEESLDFPFHIQLKLVPSENAPLLNSMIHEGVVIHYQPDQGEKDLYSWLPPIFNADPATEEGLETLKSLGYYGYVYREERKYDLECQFTELSLDIYHPLYLLESGSHSRVFFDKSLEFIFKAIFAPYEEKFSQYQIMPIVYSEDLADIKLLYCTQYQESDLHFFLRLCETFGMRFTLLGPTFRIWSAGEAPEGLELYQEKPEEGKIYNIPSNARIELSSTSGAVGRVIKYRNVAEEDVTENIATQEVNVESATDVSEKYMEYWVDIYEPNIKLAEYKMKVHSLALQHQESVIEIQNKLGNNNSPVAGIRANELLLPPSFGTPLQIYKMSCTISGMPVESSAGQTNNTDYLIKLKAREITNPFVMQPKHEKVKVHSFLRATVIGPEAPSQGDENNLGRIKVKFLWQESPDPTCWVRLMMPYAGEKHGFYIMPQIGDEVLIGFEGGDIDRPLCFGSAYNKDAKELQSHSSAKHIETMMIKTPENIYFNLHEEPGGGAQSINLGVQDLVTLNFDKGGPSASINSTGTMTLSSTKKWLGSSDEEITLDCKGGQSKTTMLSDGNITTNAEADMHLTVANGQYLNEAKKMYLRSDSDGTTVDSNGPIKVVSNSDAITVEASSSITLTVGGSSIEMTSDKIVVTTQTLELKPAMKMTVNTAAIEQNAQTVVTEGLVTHDVKGGIIKLN